MLENKSMYLSDRKSGHQIHIDLFSSLNWRAFPFLSAENLLGASYLPAYSAVGARPESIS